MAAPRPARSACSTTTQAKRVAGMLHSPGEDRTQLHAGLAAHEHPADPLRPSPADQLAPATSSSMASSARWACRWTLRWRSTHASSAAGFDKRRLDALLEQFDDLADDDEFWRLQSNSLAILATPDGMRTFRLANAVTPMVQVSGPLSPNAVGCGPLPSRMPRSFSPYRRMPCASLKCSRICRRRRSRCMTYQRMRRARFTNPP